MAKKAKSNKAKAGTRKAPSVTPTYLPKGQTYTIGLHDLVRALKVIEKHGHTAKFARAAKALRAAGTFDAKTVNFIKDFMAKQNMHTDPIGKHIVFNRNFELPGESATPGLPGSSGIRGLPGPGGTPGLPRPKRK
jgi:hypothetical protein